MHLCIFGFFSFLFPLVSRFCDIWVQRRYRWRYLCTVVATCFSCIVVRIQHEYIMDNIYILNNSFILFFSRRVIIPRGFGGQASINGIYFDEWWKWKGNQLVFHFVEQKRSCHYFQSWLNRIPCLNIQVFIESITSRQVRLDNRMKKPPKSCQSLVVRLSNAVQSLSNPQVSNVVSISQAKTCPEQGLSGVKSHVSQDITECEGRYMIFGIAERIQLSRGNSCFASWAMALSGFSPHISWDGSLEISANQNLKFYLASWDGSLLHRAR